MCGCLLSHPYAKRSPIAFQMFTEARTTSTHSHDHSLGPSTYDICTLIRILTQTLRTTRWPSKRSVRPSAQHQHRGTYTLAVTTNTEIFPKGLRYKWEAYCDTHGRYCDTNGRSTEVLPFPESSVAPKALQYKLDAYLRSSGGWGFWHSSGHRWNAWHV